MSFVHVHHCRYLVLWDIKQCTEWAQLSVYGVVAVGTNQRTPRVSTARSVVFAGLATLVTKYGMTPSSGGVRQR